MIRSFKLSLAAFAALSVTATAALAHPGHGGGLAGGLAHPLTGFDHMLAMVAVGLWASQLGKRAMIVLPLLFPAVMAVGALMGANGAALPWVEAGIVASVVILGAVVALGVKPSLAVSAVLVGVFALFHGHAHGTELPAAGSALMYGVGFIAATLVLHAIGMGIGLGTGAAAKRSLATRYAGGAIAAAGLVLLVVH